MISLFKVFMSKDVGELVTSTLNSGMITQSSKVEEFEDKLKEYFNWPYVLTLNSATSGLTLGLRLLNLQPNDEVLCVSLTCFASTCAVMANGLTIKWVDIDPETCNIDLDDLTRKISDKTKAILFVHWGGCPIDLDRLKEIAGDIPIVEDCAHAFGAEYGDKKVGASGNIGVFSLQAIKHLTTGDGGVIVLPNQEMYKRAKLLRWYGISREKRKGKGKDFRLEGDIAEWGYKYHMNDVNASIGLANIPHVQKNIDRHRENGEFYNRELANVEGVTLFKYFGNPSYWIYTLKAQNKNLFMKFMTEKNVMVSQVHKRNDGNSCLSQFASDLPQLDELEKSIVCIPCGWWVTDDQRQYIVDMIKEFYSFDHMPSIRPINISDCDAFLNLGILPTFTPPEIIKDYIESLNHMNRVYVVLYNNEVVGTTKLIIEKKLVNNLGRIEDVFIKEEYRGLGFAQKVVNHIIDEAEMYNCYKVVLNCTDNLKELYEKCGMTQSGMSMTMVFQ
jgi:dTDP-4-amino-4,6-dideoxygalactose transaminase/GNAT superfamily N-acetyltransferase